MERDIGLELGEWLAGWMGRVREGERERGVDVSTMG